MTDHAGGDVTVAPAPRAAQLAVAVVLVAATAALAVHRVVDGEFLYVVWSDRDLVRSDVAWAALPTTGAELSYGVGARLPGGAFHQVLWALLKVARDPQLVWRVQVALSGVAALVVGVAAARRWGALPGAVAAASLLAAEPDVVTHGRLWNPAWLPVPVAVSAVAALAALAPGRDPRRALVLLGAATGVGAQLHLTAWLVPVALLTAGWMQRRPRAREVGALLVGLSLPYVPYLLDEVRHGWPNTAMVWHGAQHGGSSGLLWSRDAHPLQALRDLAIVRGGLHGLEALVRDHGPWVWWTAAGAAAASLAGVALAWWRGGPLARVVVVAALVEVVVFARSKDYGLASSNNIRYLVAGSPLWALLGAASLRALLDAGRVGRVLAAVVLLGVGVRLTALGVLTAAPLDAARAWARVVRWHDGVLAATDWTPSQLAGRLVVAEREPDGWWRRHATPVDFRAQAVSDGLPAPACGLVLSVKSGQAGPRDPAVVQEALGAWVTVASVGAPVDLGPGMTFFPYTTPDGRCPSTLNDRYLPTPEELETRGAARGRVLDEGARRVWIVDAPDARRRGHWPVRVAVDGATVRLDASGLRGLAWNDGWFADHAVWRPRVEVTRPDGAVDTVVFAAGIAGELGALGPFVAPVTTGPADRLTLVWELLVRTHHGDVVLPPTPGESVRLELP